MLMRRHACKFACFAAGPCLQAAVKLKSVAATTFLAGANHTISVYMHTVSDGEYVTPAGGIQNRFGSLFFILIYMSVMSLSSLPLWMEDRLLFIRSLLFF